MDSAKGAKESLTIINRALPNIQSYLCNVLKKENLSLEAEALRARYETMLMHLEKSSKQADTFHNGGGLPPSQRHSSIAAFDRPVLTRGGTLPSPSRRRTDGDISSFRHASSMEGIHTIPEVPKTTTELGGFLLMADDHERWHKRYCRIISQKRTLTVHESASEDEEPILVIQLVGASLISDLPECDKDLNFGVKATRVSSEVSILSPVNELKLHTFAAFSEVDLNKWCSAIESIVSSQADIFDLNGSQTTVSMLSNPSRESVFSGGRMDDDTLGPIQGRPPEPLPLHDSDEGNQSDCTIYEDIDELVQQLDITIQATAQAMSEMSPKKPKKKRRRTLFEKNQNSSNKVLSEHKTKLEEGDCFTGYLYKRTGSSWKKKWCQLKGCIFSYSKSPSDATSHEHILLRAEISIVKDAKKPHAFKLACKGVKEAFFAADGEADLTEWISRLQNASKRRDDLSALVDDSGVEEGGEALPEGIYNVPRSMLTEDMIDPITNVPIAGGIYDVPRSLLAENNPQVITSQQGVEFHMSGNPFDIYDVPRSTMDNEDDTIYDNPLDFDLDDIEIYDYPPDASQLEDILPSRNSNSSNEYPIGDNDSSTHSHTPGSADGTISSTSSYRQSGSIGSIEDVSSGTASYFGDGYRSLPHNKPPQVESFISSIGNTDSSNNKSSSADLNSSQSSTVSSSMDFGQTTKTGNLLRKERLKWSQCFCLIRNSFLECHKSNATNMGKPLLKLLLLGSDVTPVQDSKKPWAFQIKHPRRDGILIFAAENSTDYKSWVEAFKNASSIKVQQVSTMEDIRISDSDLKKRWRSAEKNLGDETPHNENNKEVDDSPKRDKRKLFGRQSQRKLSRKGKNPSELFSYTCDTDSSGGQASMKRSLSMELITRPTESTPFGPKIASQAHRAISPEGLPCFQGYLKMKSNRDDKWSRMWCMFEDMMIKCYTSQRNLTGVKQIPLRGCTIARADNEVKKKFTFRIWNSNTLGSVYFSTAEEDEYHSWMAEITKGAIKQTSAGNPTPNETMAVVYYYPKDYQPQPSANTSTPNSSSNIQSRLLPEQPTKPVIDMPGVTHHGPLRKRSDKGNWNVRYCRLRDSCLYVYYTGSDQTPITVLAVKHCKIEPVKLSPDSNELHTFIVAVKGGKTHTFAAVDQQDLQNWLKVLQECVTTTSSPRPRSDSKSGLPRSQSPLLSSHSKADIPPSPSPFRGRAASLVSHVPASSLTGSTSAGYCEISHGKGAWSRNWCVLHESLLYVYQHKESKSSIRTVVLQGYKVEHIPSTDKQFSISLTHSSSSNVLLATNNQVDMMNWFQALDSATMGGSGTDQTAADVKPKTNESKPDQDNSTTVPTTTAQSEMSQRSETPSGGGLVGDVLSLEEHMKQMDGEGEAMPSLGEGPLDVTEYKEKCKLVTSHFEKRIKKTRKVAQQTEDNLKKQKEQLTTLKEKFLEHTEKLKMAPNESETSQKKRKDMEVKMSQIAKILPYLEKYMQANRQAELQTLAILKEGCTVKLQELETRYQKQLDSKLGSPSFGKLDRRMSMPANIGTSSRLNKEKKARNNSERSGLSETIKNEQPIVPLVADSNVPSVSTNYTTDSASTSTSSIVATPIVSTTTIPTSEPVIEEPAYAVVGHLKHKHSREPSLPEHYVKLQLNQDTTDSVGGSQQEIGVHYSTVHVKPKHSSPMHVATPATPPSLPVDESGSNASQDRGGVETENETERVELEMEREQSHSSPLPFILSVGAEDNDGDLLNVTSSETSLGTGLLDTVIEEESTSCSPVVMVTDTPISPSPTPCTPTNEDRESSPIPAAIAGGSSPPVCDNEDQHFIHTLSSQPSPQLSTLTQFSSIPNPSLLETMPSKSPTPLATPTPPLDIPPPPIPPTSFTSSDIKTLQTIVSSPVMNSPIADHVRTSSPTKRPPPPPVMKKTRSRSPNKQLSPSIPNKVMATPPPHSVVSQQQLQTNISPVGPPPVKTKPVRKPRSSTGPPNLTGLVENQIIPPTISNDDSTNNANPDALSRSLTSVAQRMKAFQ